MTAGPVRRLRLVRLAGLVGTVEQEIRAYPRLYASFYAVVTRSAATRALAGRAKDLVRNQHAAAPRATLDVPDQAMVHRRRQALRVRLALPPAPR